MDSPKQFLCLGSLLEDDDTEDTSGSDSDEEEIIFQILSCHPKKTDLRNIANGYFENVVPKYTDTEFKTNFRISREHFHNIVTMFVQSDIFTSINQRYNCVPAAKQVALFLWFAGHESCSFRDIAELFTLSLWSVHHIIKRVTVFISNLSPEIIVWPNEEQKLITSQYYSKRQLPNVIGLLDTTHILIDPLRNNTDGFIDRKGCTSLVVQAVCNQENRFIHVSIGHPGSASDNCVLWNSLLCDKFSNDTNFHLIGDSAYPCLPWLIVPFNHSDGLDGNQKRFNELLISSRFQIEHSFRNLKRRFRQLYYCKLRGLEQLCHMIRACCVLHNLADQQDVDLFEGPTEEQAKYDNWNSDFYEGFEETDCEKRNKIYNEFLK